MPASDDGEETRRSHCVATRASGDVLDLDVSWLVPCDLGVVDVLARLQVLVSRSGGVLLLHGVGGGLAELFEFVGLGDVMHLCRCRGGCVRSLRV